MTAEDTSILKSLRLARGMTTAELGALVGTNQQQISKLENGQRRLTLEWLDRLAVAFGVSRDELVKPSGPTTLRIAGNTGANGDLVQLVGDGGAGERVEAPPGAHDGICILVNGPYYRPRFFDGDVLIFRRALGERPETAFGAEALVKLRGERKILLRCTERTKRAMHVTLKPYNLLDPVIVDAPFEWIAPIVWVRPRSGKPQRS